MNELPQEQTQESEMSRRQKLKLILELVAVCIEETAVYGHGRERHPLLEDHSVYVTPP